MNFLHFQLTLFFLISFSFFISDPLDFAKVIIHLSLSTQKVLDKGFLIKSLSRSSLKEISILLFSKLTRLTFFSNSYFNLISFFAEEQMLLINHQKNL